MGCRMNKLPEFVENVLNEWDAIVEFACESFEVLGRGIVTIYEKDYKTMLGYADKAYLVRNDLKNEIELIKDYDPNMEILVHFEHNNDSRIIKIRTPEGRRDPKSVMNKFPEYIENVLNEWDTIVKFAYNNFEISGRGIVAVFVKDDETIQLNYIDKTFFVQKNMMNEIKFIENYDPNMEILVHFEQNNGLRTIRIRANEGGRDPKSVWFMDMFQLYINNPKYMPNNLPDWFYDKAEKLIDGLQKLDKSGE